MNNETAALLEKHFDTAFAAPDGIKKLRELILTLAMQGKLVPQDPIDRPASELLKTIEAEKKSLIKDKRINKPDPSLELNLEEAPHQLPKTWEWVTLERLATKIGSGSTPRGGKDAYVIEGIPFLRSQNIWNNGLRINDTAYISSETHNKMAATTVIPMDILLNITGASLGRCSLIPDDFNEANVSQHVTIIRCAIPETRKFIHCFLLSPCGQSMIWTRQVGMSREGLSKKVLEQFHIPLPPLAEQHRIVAEIDRLMARCDELEKLRTDRTQKRTTVHTAAIDRLLKSQDDRDFSHAWSFITQHFSELYSVKENVIELRKVILQLAVMGKLVPQDPTDEPVDNLLARILTERKQLNLIRPTDIQISKPLDYDIPTHWKWQCLNSILVAGPTNGFSPQAVDYETPVRSLTLSATTSGKFKGEYSKFIANDIPSDSNLWLRDGDILVQRGNTLEYVGVSAVYRGEANQFIYPDLMMKLRVSTEIDTNFIYLVMSSEPCRDFLRSYASGTSGTMPKINQTTLKSLPIPIPPLSEQHRIVAKTDRLMEFCDRLEESIEATKIKQTDLLNAVMARV